MIRVCPLKWDTASECLESGRWTPQEDDNIYQTGFSTVLRDCKVNFGEDGGSKVMDSVSDVTGKTDNRLTVAATVHVLTDSSDDSHELLDQLCESYITNQSVCEQHFPCFQ